MDEFDIQQRARKFIRKARKHSCPDRLDCYLEAVNAKLKEDDLPPGESGYSITTPKGTHVFVVNRNESAERQRFTVCHEIAHVVLELPSHHEEVPSWAFAKKDINEIACDIFAAELLMPYQDWLQTVPDEEPSFDLIQYMADRFETSFPAAASRYAALCDYPCAFVTMQGGFIRHASRSKRLRDLKAWISPRTRIPYGSVAYELRESGTNGIRTSEICQDIWFDNGDSELFIEELSRHYDRFDTTVSLIWFNEDNTPAAEPNRFNQKVEEDPLLEELTGELPWPGKKKKK